MSLLSDFTSNVTSRIYYQTTVGRLNDDVISPIICKADITPSKPTQVTFESRDSTTGTDIALSTNGIHVDSSLAAKTVYTPTLYVDEIQSYSGDDQSSLSINITGTANTADKLTTAKTISITGSVTGSVAFDGSSNATISTSTTHNHDTVYGAKLGTNGNYVNIQTPGSTALNQIIVPYATSSTVATSAYYADYAEYYLCKDKLDIGTVVIITDDIDWEIESCFSDLCGTVIGVVSENPGFVINAKDKDNPNAIAIAVRGKTPVRIIGPVKKGQAIVSAGNGVARAVENDSELLYKIGIAMDTNLSDEEKLVQCTVK